jgi:hypothetical protein
VASRSSVRTLAICARAKSEWSINWQNPRTPTLCVDADGHVTTKLVGADR